MTRRRRIGQRSAEDQANANESAGLAQDHRDDSRGPGAKRDADRDFTGAPRDAVRKHAVQADGRERERDARETPRRVAP